MKKIISFIAISILFFSCADDFRNLLEYGSYTVVTLKEDATGLEWINQSNLFPHSSEIYFKIRERQFGSFSGNAGQNYEFSWGYGDDNYKTMVINFTKIKDYPEDIRVQLFKLSGTYRLEDQSKYHRGRNASFTMHNGIVRIFIART